MLFATGKPLRAELICDIKDWKRFAGGVIGVG